MSSTSLPFTRQDILIPSQGETLAAWLYLPLSSTKPRHPTILLAHGLGGIRPLRLDAYACLLAQNGFLVILFDYTSWGSSSGRPRNLIDPAAQIRDWKAVLRYAQRHDSVDASRIGLFGTSFSGGHVIRLASFYPEEVKATVSQCPFTDGPASALTVGWTVLPRLAFWAVLDLLAASIGRAVRIQLLGRPGEVALMNTSDSIPGYLGLIPPSMDAQEYIKTQVPARVSLSLPLLRPGVAAAKVTTPILFAICGKDTVAPPGPTMEYARRAPKGVIKLYEDLGHFDIYVGQAFQSASREYLDFFKQHLMERQG